MPESGEILNGPEIDQCHRHSGKVRESYVFENGVRAILVTDRVSAFDYVLGATPGKGAMLNAIAADWFKRLGDLDIPTHFLHQPHPNVTYNRNADVVPIEFVVRGYLTGSTTTSSWFAYQNHSRIISGVEMPKGMKKNEKFRENILTPSTKAIDGHDENISPAEIIERWIMTQALFDRAADLVMKVFELGQKVASHHGLILVDTKYELGLLSDGTLIFVDEVHTPDSSRYWIADSYEQRLANGKEPESLDKEFVRRMLIDNGYDPASDASPVPYFTDDLKEAAISKYQALSRKFGLEPNSPRENASALRDALDGARSFSFSPNVRSQMS